MGFIEDLIKKVTGGSSVGEVVGDAAKKATGGFGLSAFGDVSEIIAKLQELTGMDLSSIADLAKNVDPSILGNIALIGQGKFDFENMDVLNTLKSQIGELDGGLKDKVTGVISKLPIDKSNIDKILK